ncbi:MAG: M67 family metallopeptidase [Gemmatimonadales bacterium]
MHIDHAALVALRQHLISAYPAEGCGLLIGSADPDGDTVVQRHSPVRNSRLGDGGGHHRYSIPPGDFLSVERDAGASGFQVVGVYHSHPNVSARPSSYDQEHAWPWYRYLIVSIFTGVVRDQRVWGLTDDRDHFVEEVLYIKES